ncbi:hypothetical protein [Paraburkholderia diazotrophica]|uniref:hypothetical protein n=1 Tax=Paraburkholderia diazotrophica TaxID=667676 RepID=UPI00319EAFDD
MNMTLPLFFSGMRRHTGMPARRRQIVARFTVKRFESLRRKTRVPRIARAARML